MALFRPCKLKMWQQITSSNVSGRGEWGMRSDSLTAACPFNMFEYFIFILQTQLIKHVIYGTWCLTVRKWPHAWYPSSIIRPPLAPLSCWFWQYGCQPEPPDPATDQQLPSRPVQPPATPQGHRCSSLTEAKEPVTGCCGCKLNIVGTDGFFSPMHCAHAHVVNMLMWDRTAWMTNF